MRAVWYALIVAALVLASSPLFVALVQALPAKDCC
jgi:hypothetical protein